MPLTKNISGKYKSRVRGPPMLSRTYQIWSLIFFPPSSTVFILKSIPGKGVGIWSIDTRYFGYTKRQEFCPRRTLPPITHPLLMKVDCKGVFSLHWTSGLPRTGRSLRLIWRWTLDPKPLFTPNGSVGRAIPDYFGANQWCRTCVSGNENHPLLITSKESLLAI